MKIRAPRDAVSGISPQAAGRFAPGKLRILPLLPGLPTGFDDTPQCPPGNATIVTGRTPEEFRRLCRDARKYADRNRIELVIIGPVNDWANGSFIEPGGESGFGFYEAIHDTFGVNPREGWPENGYPPDLPEAK